MKKWMVKKKNNMIRKIELTFDFMELTMQILLNIQQVLHLKQASLILQV